MGATEKNIEYYINLHYPILLSHRTDIADPYWFAEIPDLPGCCADGRTPDEAVSEIEDAKREWIKDHVEGGHEIPMPSSSAKRVLSEFPLYLMIFDNKRYWVSIKEAGRLYDFAFTSVSIGGYVLEKDGIERPITDLERRKIVTIADDYSGNK